VDLAPHWLPSRGFGVARHVVQHSNCRGFLDTPIDEISGLDLSRQVSFGKLRAFLLNDFLLVGIQFRTRGLVNLIRFTQRK
jgi:hypothetical protein